MAASHAFGCALALSAALLAGCGAQTTSSLEENLHEGVVTVLARPVNAGAPTAVLHASFSKSRKRACDRRDLGEGCWATTCSNGNDTYTYASAGNVRAAFADTGPALDATPAGDVTYFASATLPASAPRPGSLLTIESSGGEVPAFRSTLVVPPSLVLDAPSETRATSGTAPYEPVEMLVGAEQDLELRFIDAPDGVRLMVDATPSSNADGGTLIACDLEIRKGAVVIPANALDAARHRELRLIAATVEDLHAGDWSVKAALGGDVWAKIAVGQSASLVPLTVRVQ